MASEHHATNFWQDKVPCWEIRGCIGAARELCPASRDCSRPCWEQRTLTKEMFGIDTCLLCEVRRRYTADWEPDAPSPPSTGGAKACA